MARTMGLHSIIGVISKHFEASFRKSEAANTLPSVGTSNHMPKAQGLISIFRKRTLPKPEAAKKKCKRKRLKFKNPGNDNKTYKGITCDATVAKGHFSMASPMGPQYDLEQLVKLLHIQTGQMEYNKIAKTVPVL